MSLFNFSGWAVMTGFSVAGVLPVESDAPREPHPIPDVEDEPTNTDESEFVHEHLETVELADVSR
jgi:hypothetical protein